MRKIITTLAVCAAGLLLNASGQDSSSATPGTTSDQSTQPSASSSTDTTRRWATGRMGQQETRASKLMNAEVKSSQGQTLGTINDIVLNPSSGRIDFAVISTSPSLSSGVNATPNTSSPPAASPTPTTDTSISSSSSIGGKLVAVPWMLVRHSSSSTAGGISATTGQPTLVFAGDASKLQSAPSFDQSNWPDVSQSTWRQSIYSHFGMAPGASSTGGATSPGGTDSSSGSSSTPGKSSSIPPSSSYPDTGK